jgi:hypothetical protein
MNPSHLAAIMLAGLGIGGMSHAAASMPQPEPVHLSSKISVNPGLRSLNNYLLTVPFGSTTRTRGEAPPASWHRLNQRQIRKNRRRAHAAGSKKAF